MSKRNERVSMELKKEISKILLSEIKDPRLTAMPGVIAVKVTEDMSYADVFVSLYGDEKSKAETLKAIESASGFIRRQLSRRLKLRYVPELRFNCDDFIEQGFRINSILDSLKKDKNNAT
ncbi:MAG: 30S ribosome-binding factor RbfA [Clostridiales bacterium]|nr:30S ribosome-binding factor RbfA [Clostridiales bacterium]